MAWFMISPGALANFTILDAQRWPAGEGKIILTFDDGPNARQDVSMRLLDVLGRHDVKGTFFYIGRRVEAYPDIVARTVREGHQVGVHAYSHGWPVWFDSASLRREIETARTAIRRAANRPDLPLEMYRPPRGILTPATWRLLAQCEIALGHLTAYHRDSGSGPAEANEVLQAAKETLMKYSGGVIVFHSSRYKSNQDSDNLVDKSWLPAAIEDLILWARDREFEFTHYPGITDDCADS